MVRAAILISDSGTLFQSVLDSMYFGEIPDFQLVSVISTVSNENAMRRTANAGVPFFVVEPEHFPTSLSHSMAIANKLKDMDIDLVILAGYELPLGVISAQFRKRIIGIYPSLAPAFEDCEGRPEQAALERGCTVTGATVYFADIDGRIGPIIAQKAVNILPDDTPDTLHKRILEEAEWKLLPDAVALFCKNRLEIRGDRVTVKGE